MATRFSSKIKKAAQNLRSQQAQPMGASGMQQAFQQQQAGQGTAGSVGQATGQSNIQEILGIQAQRQQGEQTAQQLEQQAMQAESEERQFEATRKAEKLENDANYNQALNQQFNKFEQNSLDMDAEEEELELEVLGFQLALKDKQYMAELDRRARQSNLQDELAFKEETAKLVMGEDLANFRNQLDFKLQQNKLDINNMEALSQISLDDAFAAANFAMQEQLIQAESAGYQQLGSAVGQGIGAYGETDAGKENFKNWFG